MNGNKIISCILVDEPGSLEMLQDFIAAVPYLKIEASFCNTIEALCWLQEHNIDLIFIEINMPLLSGSQLVRAIKSPPKIIFTTSHRKYAMEGFELDAVDFLLKPFSFERFIRAINKVTSSTAELNGNGIGPGPVEFLNGYRFFKAERKMIKVSLDDILFIESFKDYIKVVTKSGTIVTRQSISYMEESLPKHLFFRIHRSFIVSFKYIDCFTAERIEISKYSLPVSRPYRHELESRLR